MKHGLLLGLDGSGKTLLLRQLALQLLKNHKSVVDRIVALAQSASCLSSGDAVVATRGTSPSADSPLSSTDGGAVSTHLAADGAALASLAASNVLQNARNFASNHPTLALGYSNTNETKLKEEKVLDHATQPTIGVEHTALTIDGKTFSICEIGGQLLPMWKSYFDASEFWMFVIDISSPVSLAGAAIEFFNILKNEAMRRKPKLLLLNHIDACWSMDDAMIRATLCLDRLMTDAFNPSTSSGSLHVLKISALSGENTDAVLKWIAQRWHNTAVAPGPSPAHVAAVSRAATFSSRAISFNKTEKQRVYPLAR